MKKMLPESELARDERFVRSKIEIASSIRAAPRSRLATPVRPRWPPTAPPRPSVPAR
jgi:hypothetical protein